MKECGICNKEYPDHLVNSMTIENYIPRIVRDVCPLCALALRNRLHGLSKDTPFQGEMANDMWEEAMEYAIDHDLYGTTGRLFWNVCISIAVGALVTWLLFTFL